MGNLYQVRFHPSRTICNCNKGKQMCEPEACLVKTKWQASLHRTCLQQSSEFYSNFICRLKYGPLPAPSKLVHFTRHFITLLRLPYIRSNLRPLLQPNNCRRGRRQRLSALQNRADSETNFSHKFCEQIAA